MASENVVHFTDSDFDIQVLKSDMPVLVDFWAIWCGPCKMISPLIDEIANQYEGKIKVGKLNVDENPNTASRFGVRGIPTLILFQKGKIIDQIIGAVPKGQIESMVKKAADQKAVS